ncbi:MAG: Ribosomal RNA small subunit methyltransferase G [Turneriella sp.]|nr:Ribosomal RNA small subunit methyltransferase G [Turneriella sp.]
MKKQDTRPNQILNPKSTHREKKDLKIFQKRELLSLLKDIPQVDADKIEKLLFHWQKMLESEDRTDLTRLEKAHDIALKHYLDSALPLKFIKLPSPLLDIGTGAGFPGLVLKILSPETHVILGEVRPKRVEFLRSVIRDLKLTQIEVFAHRIGPQFPLEIQGVVTRALESARDTVYRVAPFLPQGGKIILLKGPRGEEEIVDVSREFNDFKHKETFNYTLAQTHHKRQLIIFERVFEKVRQSGEVARSTLPSKIGTNKKTEITSRANPVFKMLSSLENSRSIARHEKYLVSGQKLVNEIIHRYAKNVRALIFDATKQDLRMAANFEIFSLAPALFREVDFLGSKNTLALLNLPKLVEWKKDTIPGITVFLPFQDPGNLGAAIRSAAAFGAKRVVLLKEASSPFLPKAVRAAANALFEIEILYGPSLTELLTMPLELYRLDAAKGGKNISEIKFPKSVMLVVGVEGYGFIEKGQSIPIEIPITSKVESLNAQAALAVALYEISRRLT